MVTWDCLVPPLGDWCKDSCSVPVYGRTGTSCLLLLQSRRVVASVRSPWQLGHAPYQVVTDWMFPVAPGHRQLWLLLVTPLVAIRYRRMP